jgi:hypothetical protein
MRLGVAGACAMVFAASSTVLAKDPALKPGAYCTQGASGQWTLHRFKPLIKVHGGTVFTEMTFDGPVLREVRLRHFFADSELAFAYNFDASGKLVALHGAVTAKSVAPPGADAASSVELADWMAEADLTPGDDGKIPLHHVQYSRENDRIDEPMDAKKYVGQFDDAPVFRTIHSVPCAAMLKEAEKMNATQE